MGQWLDVSLNRENADADAFIDMIGKKTGALIQAAAMAGAVLAGAPAPGLAAIGDYGAALGLAFQLRDDLADAGRTGSSAGLDAVALFGREGARARLEEYVTAALAALDRGKIGSAELRHLAGTLSPGRGA